ncbi:MAG: protein-disulfide reductase DsbD family protein [Gammaproteobacteria bacterium]|nr:protein-disulfide reductase DsbD family protein [Gammaproteobacteria bacterium]
MKNLKVFFIAWCVLPALAAVADEMSFPDVMGTSVEGAPDLSKPVLVMGGELPIKTEKHGLAAPALFDWDGDGKRDLLVGEFETNSGDLFPMGKDGSTIRIYKNVGTDNNPTFTESFEWARDTEGTIMEVEQWCCIGFTPYFYDLNDDGFIDMVTGQYHPGEVTWFKGSAEGFLPGVKLPQEGDPTAQWNPFMGADDGPKDEIETFNYWVYSSAAMGDFDDDGDFDLIFGGGGGLRISENIGTPKEPKFGRRQLLLDETGNPLVVRNMTDEEKELLESVGEANPSGDVKTSPYVVDWDRDGVLDLLVTGSYTKPGDPAVMFFKGVKTDDGHRFKQGVDLLATPDGSKALPGSGPRVYVDDWNGDGIHDLIIGASVATVSDGEFSDELSWEWESVNQVEAAGKDPGRYPPRERPTEEGLREQFGASFQGEELEEMVQMNLDYWESTVGKLYKEGKGHWLTMRHQGRIYVMLGSETESPSTSDSASVPTLGDPSLVQEAKAKPKFMPVSVDLHLPQEMDTGEQAEVSVTFTIADGWFIYAPTGRNVEHGLAETEVSFAIPEEFERVGEIQRPAHQFKGMYDIFSGPSVNIGQWFATDNTDPGTYNFSVRITFQTCKDDLCLPKQTETLDAELVVLAAN